VCLLLRQGRQRAPVRWDGVMPAVTMVVRLAQAVLSARIVRPN